MNVETLKSKIQLENDKVLLLPFENQRNQELKEIIFEKEIWKFMGMEMKNDEDFEKYLTATIKDKTNGICYPFLIIDKKSDRVAGSTRYGYLNAASFLRMVAPPRIPAGAIGCTPPVGPLRLPLKALRSAFSAPRIVVLSINERHSCRNYHYTITAQPNPN